MAHCDEYSELISASLDGALSPAETEKLNAHLAQCPDCRALFEELSTLHAALSDLPPVEVPSGLTERIMAAVAAEQVLPFAPPEQKKPSIRWQRWLASAAVLAVVLLGTWSWKPWENTMTKDAKPESAAQAAQQIVASDSSTALPEASEAVEAAPEGVLAYTTSGEAPDNAAAPAPASQVLPTSGKSFAAKISGESQDAILPMSTDNDLPAAAPEETELIAPRMATRAMPENGIGDSGEETPALFSALPAETPEETAAPAVQSFMVTSMLTSNELTSSEAADPVEMTPREALERLVGYIFEYSGYDGVEYISEGDGLYAQVTAQGCGGKVYFLPEQEDETFYWFEFHPEIGDDVYYYTVDRLTGEPTSLLGE